MNPPARKSYFLAILTMAVAACSCSIAIPEKGELRKESRSVPVGGAKSAQVELKMGAGTLVVGGGGNALLDADFSYNVAQWKPRVEYDVKGGEGHLTVEQPSGGGRSFGGTEYQWNLRLNNKVPMEITVEQGAGRTELTLGSLSLSKLDVKVGAGETIVDLSGNWKRNLDAMIKGGVGKATVRLPREVGVRVVAKGGLGSISASDLRRNGDAYVNDAYGKSRVTLSVDVEGGVGEIVLELGGAAPGTV